MDTSRKLDNYVGYLASGGSIAISLGLFALMIGLLVKFDPSRPDTEIFYMVTLGMVAPFALFFGVVGVGGIASQVANRKELMSLNGWRVLAALILICGCIGFILGNWGALLVPVAIAVFCMMKDQRFIELLKSLRLLR
ncbi:hypothetical protein ACFL3A_08535 [Pseudomonadota bacterium]